MNRSHLFTVIQNMANAPHTFSFLDSFSEL